MGEETSEVFCKLGTDISEVFRVIVQRYGLQLFRWLKSGVYLVAHVELVQVYVVDCFLLHGCRVTLPSHTLVSSNHSYSACGRKLDHHVVRGGNGLYGVERGSSQQNIISRWGIYYEKLHCHCCLAWGISQSNY